jgi:hypothetical protein
MKLSASRKAFMEGLANGAGCGLAIPSGLLPSSAIKKNIRVLTGGIVDSVLFERFYSFASVFG